MMALTETKVIQTANDPVTINNMNNEWGCFGWSVLSVQITHSQDSRTYTKGLDYLTGDLTTETTTINYATITYQRDRKMPNHARIASLEQEYLRLRQELADEVERIEKEERQEQISGLFGQLKQAQPKRAGFFNPLNRVYAAKDALDSMIHPKKHLDNAKKQWGAVIGLGKIMMGTDTRSEETVQRTNELTQQCAVRLAAIREEAESLL